MAAIIKFIGKGFGTIAAAAGALRTAEWRVFGGRYKLVLVDRTIRFEDGLAASIQILHHIAAQIYVEGEILRRSKTTARPHPLRRDADGPGACLPFSAVENAARRLLDYVAEHAVYRDAVAEHGLRMALTKTGHSQKLKTLRTLCFERGAKREITAYGGVDAYKKFALAEHWQALMVYLETGEITKQVKAEEGSDSPTPTIILCRGAALSDTAQETLRRWQLAEGTLQWLGVAPAASA